MLLESGEGPFQVRPDGLGGHSRHGADGDEGGTQVGVAAHRSQVVAFTPAADDRAYFQPGESGNIPGLVGQLGFVDGVDGLEHFGNGVHAGHIRSRGMPPPEVEGKVGHSRVLGHYVVRAVGLGHHPHVGLVAVVHQVLGAQTPL